MKRLETWFRRCFVALGLGFGLAVVAGCSTPQPLAEVNPSRPFVFPGEAPEVPAIHTTSATGDVALASNSSTAIPVPVPPAHSEGATILRAGDQLQIAFADLPAPGLQEVKLRLSEEGRITLPYNITVNANGKTVSQLQQEIRAAYVPRLYHYMTVTVRTDERFYYVSGEVRNPSRQQYLGQMTVLRAIDTAQGFTDFADRRNIEIRRSNGQKLKVNWKKALENPALDLPVFPDDQIIVNKRLL